MTSTKSSDSFEFLICWSLYTENKVYGPGSIEVTKKEMPVHEMQVDIVALLNEMKSLQEEFKSTKSDIEAMIDSKFEKDHPSHFG